MNKGELRGQDRVSAFLWVIDRLRLAWRLFWDDRVSGWLKLVPLFPVLYIIWPLDLLSDPLLGVGQMDDLAVVVLGLRLFISLCPADLVAEHWRALTRGKDEVSQGGETVEGEYRVLDEDQLE
ncbi:MAG: DUF1232 domain-containing protein [Chloroflexota bacterium]|nr:DUF1232 domain-containing protein [Chloroflexota bacterium]